MITDPRSLHTTHLWSLAKSAEKDQQWQTAYDTYAQLVLIYKDLGDNSETLATLEVMCKLAKEHEMWSCAAEAAKMLIAFLEGHFDGPPPEIQLLLGQAERHCHNNEAARRILANLVRTSEARLPDEWRFRYWVDDMHLCTLALHEWALLEASEGMIAEAIRLMALGELMVNQCESAPIDAVSERIYKASEAKLTALHDLREIIIADRIRLQSRL